MSASSAAIRSSLQPEAAAPEETVREAVVMLIERGRTEKYGWLSAFDELDEYLGRMS